jgi:prepilin-type N-terminal cleavage/methylation domain-containing protein
MRFLSTRLRRDDGMTLPELLISMVLMGAVAAFVSGGLIGAHEIFRSTDDQTQGLQDARVAAERLGRDIRDARAVLCNPAGTPAALVTSDPTCQYHLQLWVDYNSNYKQEPAETVTWRLRLRSGGGPVYYDLVRAVGGATEIVQARTIIEQIAFTYDYPPGATQPPPGAAHATTVNTDMRYDAKRNTGTSSRTVTFSGRLRNVS